MQEHELELMIDSWRRLDGESRSHVATQLRQEVIDRLRYGEEIPEDYWIYRFLKRQLFFGMGGYG